MYYPPAPVKYQYRSQLRGLENGEWLMQPKWNGRRAVKIPGQNILYKSQKPVDCSPWKDLVIPNVDHPMDLELLRDRVLVLDLMLPIPLSERIQLMDELGLEHMAMFVDSFEKINQVLTTCLTSGLCDGVVLKRLDSKYPIGRQAQIKYSSWIKVKEPVEI